MKKYTLYSFIHTILYSTPRSAVTFFCFFSVSAAFEFFLSRLMLSLAFTGQYDFHLAARYAPVMAEAALASVLLSVIGGALFCRLEKSKDGICR